MSRFNIDQPDHPQVDQLEQPLDQLNQLDQLDQTDSFLQFFQRWLSQNGVPLLLLFGIYFPLAVFGLLAMQIWQRDGGLTWDLAILNRIHSTAQPMLDQLAQMLTPLGTKFGVFPATLLIAGRLLYVKHWRSLTYWLIALVGGGLLNRFAKLWLHRVRPSLWDSPPLPDFSFPSGHAMSSMVFVMALILLTIHQPWHRWVWLLGGLFVVTIGWTRLYLGVHYPSDILAGWMLSIAWVIAVSLVVRPTRPITEETLPHAEASLSDQNA